jgi:hypothetical protein
VIGSGKASRIIGRQFNEALARAGFKHDVTTGMDHFLDTRTAKATAWREATSWTNQPKNTHAYRHQKRC